MMSLCRCATFLAIFVSLSAAGCNSSSNEDEEAKDGGPEVQQKESNDDTPTKKVAKRPIKRSKKRDPESLISTSFINSNSPTAQTARIPGLGEADAVNKVLAAVNESIQNGPTLVVWLFDQTQTSWKSITGAQTLIQRFYRDLEKSDNRQARNLSTAIVAFGSQTRWLLEEPSNNPEEVIAAFGAFEQDSSGKEMTFSAIRDSLKRYVDFRTKHRYSVLFVVMTDETGDDQPILDDILADSSISPKRMGIPIYVIGVPAPFGRTAGLKGSPEPSISQGPETRSVERIKLDFWANPHGLDRMDSGFGPFSLERLCRASGGRFLAVRPNVGKRRFMSSFDGGWPNRSSGRFDPAVMRRYTPTYISDSDYQQKLQSNQALMSLNQAATMRSSSLTYPPVEFIVRTEARLQTDVTNAQKVVARLEPEIDRIYQVLDKGKSDRDDLTEPRWQASYDLAMGRVLAAKARIEGYNAMLASLKRGKKFEQEGSDRWILEPAQVTTEAGSTLRKMGEQARMYLQRVVDDHDGTPWAKIAASELENDIGWKWKEAGPNSY